MADFTGDDLGGAASAIPYLSGVYESVGYAPINLAGNDTIAPVVDPTTPTASPVSPSTPLSFTVSDNVQIKGCVVVASYVGSNTRELIWDHVHGFNGFYLGSQNHVTVTRDASNTVVVEYAFTILRDGGWPANIDVTVFAYDDAGNDAVGF